MALFNRHDINSVTIPLRKTAATYLVEGVESFSNSKNYDIFLSHSYLDKETIAKMKVILESYGYSTYVDWIEDRQLDRGKITISTAETLKIRMKACRCLLFATSLNSSNSIWMPWELGFFDGYREKVAILPIVDDIDTEYVGQEYLGIYPYVEKLIGNRLWVTSNSRNNCPFDKWILHGFK